ncbi:MAG: hypothetical protein QF387_03660 [Arenicellales bacterium]|nr:hypothetical protein [Arenicellales bacterium]MDP7521961.1 hypothetical protein [Arenicellales bacterium]
MDRIILLFSFALLLFVTPLTDWWLSDQSPWYLPYLIWLLVILLNGWFFFRRGRHDL